VIQYHVVTSRSKWIMLWLVTGAVPRRDVHSSHPSSYALLHVQRGISVRHHVRSNAACLLSASRLRREGDDGNYRVVVVLCVLAAYG